MQSTDEYNRIFYELRCGHGLTKAWVINCRLNQIVADLLRLIKAEHNRLLKDYDPGDLIIYEKGTTIDDYKSKDALEIDLPLSDDQIQGTSKDNPILVVLSPSELPRSTANTIKVDTQQTTQHVLQFDQMKSFFETHVKDLQLDSEGFIAVKWMSWFDVEINRVFWRSCYSYILCSTIAFFEKAHKDYVNGEVRREKRSMVLTGVQGTGKSILGCFIGLVMGKVFGWQVTYIFGDMHHHFGDPNDDSKRIEICDLSRNKTDISNARFKFVVSSANSDRWHDVAQQQTWSASRGNYCYIDTASEEEIGRMMAGKSWSDAFHYAGGVPRLCSTDHNTVKGLIDGALKRYTIYQIVNGLSLLQDVMTADGQKLFPGLIGHIVPTNKFRNEFSIQVASRYVVEELAKAEEINSSKEHEKLMNEFLGTSKARAFAGWLWEALFEKKCKQNNVRITVIGSALPFGDESNVQTIFEAETSSLRTFAFESFDDFKVEAESFLNQRTDFCAIAKARSDTFQAIDAILMQRQGEDLLIAGLQLTVSARSHPVHESTIIEFVKTCSNMNADPRIELWFLQPEKSLSYTHLVGLQPMVFDEPTLPSTSETNTATFCRGKRKRSSNNKIYWDLTIRHLQQIVGIVLIEETTSTAVSSKATAMHSKFKSALKDRQEAGPRLAEEIGDPKHRAWADTMKIRNVLKQHLHESLDKKIRSDLADDKEDLECNGYVFPNEDAETEAE